LRSFAADDGTTRSQVFSIPAGALPASRRTFITGCSRRFASRSSRTPVKRWMSGRRFSTWLPPTRMRSSGSSSRCSSFRQARARSSSTNTTGRGPGQCGRPTRFAPPSGRA